MMPEKKNADTDIYASSEEETEVGEERIQPGPLRAQLHVDVDKLDEVREAGTDGDGSSSQKIMFDTVDEEFEGIMDDEKVWDSIPKKHVEKLEQGGYITSMMSMMRSCSTKGLKRSCNRLTWKSETTKRSKEMYHGHRRTTAVETHSTVRCAYM
jgi:hypothetical protein